MRGITRVRCWRRRWTVAAEEEGEYDGEVFNVAEGDDFEFEGATFTLLEADDDHEPPYVTVSVD